jgi:WD40 repeat protein
MRKTSLPTYQARCRSMRSLCLVVLVAACTTAPASSHGLPTASGSAQVATISAYRGHTGTVFAVAWSPDGTRIASEGNDGTIQVWEASRGYRLLTFTGHTAPVRGVAWSPDSTRLGSSPLHLIQKKPGRKFGMLSKSRSADD